MWRCGISGVFLRQAFHFSARALSLSHSLSRSCSLSLSLKNRGCFSALTSSVHINGLNKKVHKPPNHCASSLTHVRLYLLTASSNNSQKKCKRTDESNIKRSSPSSSLSGHNHGSTFWDGHITLPFGVSITHLALSVRPCHPLKAKDRSYSLVPRDALPSLPLPLRSPS